MSNLVEVRVPRMNASDDSVVIREWMVSSGQSVEAGSVIAVCESSKAAFEVVAPEDGYLHYRADVDSEIAVGAVLAVLSGEQDHDWSQAESRGAGTLQASCEISKSARALMEQHSVPLSVFADSELVTRTDVEAYLAAQAGPPPVEGNQVVVIGGRGHGQVCLDILALRPEYRIAGVVDDAMEKGQTVLGAPVLGTLRDLPALYKSGIRKAVMGIGSILKLELRARLNERAREIGFEMINLIHPRAIVEPSVRMGSGVQILAGGIVGSAVQLHDDCVVNSGVVVSHDSVVHRNAHLAPGCLLAGNVTVGADTLVGMGVTVYLGVTLGRDVMVHNGQNIVHDIADGTVVAPSRESSSRCEPA